MREYIHPYERSLERELCLLNEDPAISKENRELMLGFYRHNQLNNISIPRLVKQLGTLRLVVDYVKKSFLEVERVDYEDFMLHQMEKKLSPATISTYGEVLKVFHKWVAKSETCPPCVSWIKCNSKKSKKLPEDLLTQEDVKKLLGATSSPRDKALIALLWETGARIGELGGLDIKDAAFDELGCKLSLDGKTGMRRIRIVNAASELLAWLNKHPMNQDPNAPIFLNIYDNFGQRMLHRNIVKILQVSARKAGVKKPVNPHQFRHSRATYMAQFLTEAQLKEYFGWVQESKMAANYVHLSGKQVDDAILRMHGLIKEDKQEDILKRVSCPRCKKLNESNNSHCDQCWLPLTQKAAVEAEENKRKEETGIIALMKLINKYRDNPERLAETIRLIETGGAQA